MTGSDGYVRLTCKSVDEVADIVRNVDNGGMYVRRHPLILNAPEYIRRHVAEHVGKRVAPPRGFVAEISEAIVRHPGFLFTQDSIVSESLVNLYGTSDLRHWMPVKIGADGDYLGEPERFLDGPYFEETAVLLAQNSDQNYGHWIVECLPKIDLIDELYDLRKLKFIVGYPNSTMDPIYEASLAAAGISWDQVIRIGLQPMRFRKLIYPGPVTDHPWINSPRALRYLDRIAAVVSERFPYAPRSERLFITRNRIGRRRLLNEDILVDHLSSQGFTTVSPETMSFEEQVCMFSCASVILGNLGGGLSGVAFSPKNVKVLAATTEFMADDFFFDIVSQKDGQYISVHGPATSPELGMQSDFAVDEGIFLSIADSL